MSVPPTQVINFKCVRRSSEVLTFYYKDGAGDPVDMTGKTFVAEFSEKPDGISDFVAPVEWNAGSGLATVTFSRELTDIGPAFYYSYIRVVADAGDSDVAILKVGIEIVSSFP